MREALNKLFYGEKKRCNDFAHICKNMALAYLKSKIASGDHYLMEISDNLDDVAWDCIADLFERDEEGNYVELQEYYSGIDLQNSPEPKLKIKTRRLVFSKVNDGIFRIYGNYDSSLRKIIRNIKNACQDLGLEVERVNGSNRIIFDEKNEGGLPVMPPEFIEIHLSGCIGAKMSMKEVIKEVIDIFNNQQLYEGSVPLVDVARAIRSIHVKNHPEIPSNQVPEFPLFTNGELKKVLNDSVSDYKSRFYRTYVKSGKIDETVFEQLMNTVRDILRHHYVEESAEGDSYFDHFKNHANEVDKSRYRDEYRQYLEYMVKLVRKDLIQRLKNIY